MKTTTEEQPKQTTRQTDKQRVKQHTPKCVISEIQG